MERGCYNCHVHDGSHDLADDDLDSEHPYVDLLVSVDHCLVAHIVLARCFCCSLALEDIGERPRYSET